MRTARATLLIAVIALIAGCGQPGTTEDLIFLGSPNGITVVDTGATSPTFQAANAITSTSWSTVVRTKRAQGATRITAASPLLGTDLWERTVPGNLQAKVVSEGGDLVALGPSGERHYRMGRSYTRIVVVGNDSDGPRTIDLKGNFEPEAFSTDGKSLFVLRFIPAGMPTSYQVRRLDIATEEVHDVFTEDGHLQTAMRGDARVQVASPDGRRLYTLYTVGAGTQRHAFIHVLALDELWAHCIDLPHGFTDSAQSASAMSVSRDGTRLHVANSVTGAVAEIDTTNLEVIRESQINFGLGNSARAVQGPEGTIFLASGRRLAEVDAATLTESGSWMMPSKVSGIQVSRDGRRIYVGLRADVVIIDTVTGERVGTYDPPGINRIDQLGRVLQTPGERLRKVLSCAC